MNQVSTPTKLDIVPDLSISDFHTLTVMGIPMQRVGKKHAGRKLDGQVWQELPHA